jgi:hypothetical protein
VYQYSLEIDTSILTVDVDAVKRRFESLLPTVMRMRRLIAAAESRHDAGERFLEHLIEPLSRGDPEFTLRWTCKSVGKLAQELGGVVTVSATVLRLTCCTS